MSTVSPLKETEGIVFKKEKTHRRGDISLCINDKFKAVWRGAAVNIENIKSGKRTLILTQTGKIDSSPKKPSDIVGSCWGANNEAIIAAVRVFVS